MSAPAATAPTPETRAATAASVFFRLLYGRGAGHLELAWIDGDPDDRQGHRFGRAWFAYRPERLGELLARIEALARRYGNVYVSAHLYAAPRRDAPILPGQAIVVDDLPAGVPCSFSVQTSPGSRHGYFLLDRPVAGDELRDLARRAAYALGGDRGGWDAQQLVRVPGTTNTKARHGGRYPVALQLDTRRRYRPDELRDAWPEAGPGEAAPEALDWPEVEHWLGNLPALLGESGLPRRVKPTTQTGRVLLAPIADSSLARYIVARGLALHGYPDAELAALLWHFCDYGAAAAKGTAWLKADIQRIIAKVRSELPNVAVSPTRARGDTRGQPIPEQPPARRGRKTTLTPAALLAWYEGQRSSSDVIMLTVSEAAERLGVSRATVERCERALRAAGAIERRTFNRRQSSLVALLRPATAPAADPAAPAQIVDARPLTIPEAAPAPPHENSEARPLTIPEAAPAPSRERTHARPLTILGRESAAPAENTGGRPLTIPDVGDTPHSSRGEPADSRPRTTAPLSGAPARLHVPSAKQRAAQQDAENTECIAAGGTHAPEGAPPAPGQPEADPPPPPLTPPTMLAPAAPPATRTPTPKTAVAEAFDYLASRKRKTRQMVVMFIESKYPALAIPDRALDRLIVAERQQRAWAHQIAQLRSLPPRKLTSLSRMIDRVLAEGPGGPQGAQLAWAGALSPHVNAELERRAELRDALDPQRRRRERAEYLALAERAFRRPRAEGRTRTERAPPQAGTAGGVCSPQPALTQHELFSPGTNAHDPGAAGLVARLRQLKEQRSSGEGVGYGAA